MGVFGRGWSRVGTKPGLANCFDRALTVMNLVASDGLGWRRRVEGRKKMGESGGGRSFSVGRHTRCERRRMELEFVRCEGRVGKCQWRRRIFGRGDRE